MDYKYICDLPANTGNTDILRAIYAKIDDKSMPNVEEKLDTIIDQMFNVNYNILNNKDANNIQVNIDTNLLVNSIEKIADTIKDTKNDIINIVNLQPYQNLQSYQDLQSRLPQTRQYQQPHYCPYSQPNIIRYQHLYCLPTPVNCKQIKHNKLNYNCNKLSYKYKLCEYEKNPMNIRVHGYRIEDIYRMGLIQYYQDVEKAIKQAYPRTIKKTEPTKREIRFNRNINIWCEKSNTGIDINKIYQNSKK